MARIGGEGDQRNKAIIMIRGHGLLGHPEGPYELDDGRVIYANTYASEIGVRGPEDQ